MNKMPPVPRILTAPDTPELERFLAPRTSSSMFLLSNSRRSGLLDTGKPVSGTYAAAFDDQGSMTAVAAVYWNGMAILQADQQAPDLVQLASRAADRPLKGLIGLRDQVYKATSALGLPTAGPIVQLHAVESLYELNLNALVIPEMLRTGRVRARLTTPADLDLVADWDAQLGITALGATDSPAHRAAARENVARQCAENRAWLLEDEGRPVSRSIFSARIAEAVQVGGVWTPPEFRNRGYARCVVAASLQAARAAGAQTAVLFTNDDNPAANKAYATLGFNRIADWCILLYRGPVSI